MRASKAVVAQQRIAIAPATAPVADVAIAGSAGTFLPSKLRARLEAAFGADLAAVRLHNDVNAIRALRQRGTRGFAAGRDVFVDLATHDLGTERGLQLLGHEVAHVLQQTGRATRDGIVATAKTGSPNHEPQHDETFIERLEGFFDAAPSYSELKVRYAKSKATSWFPKTDVLIGTDWSSVPGAATAIIKLIKDPGHRDRPEEVRAFLTDCAKGLGAYDFLAPRAITGDGPKLSTAYRSFALYKHLRASAKQWLPAAVEMLPGLAPLHPELQIEALRSELFSLESAPYPALQDPWQRALAWARDGRGEIFIAATDAVTGLRATLTNSLRAAAKQHGKLPTGDRIDVRRAQARFIAQLRSPFPAVEIEDVELRVLLELIWPRLVAVAAAADNYWSAVITVRDAFASGDEMDRSVAELGASLRANPMFPMLGEVVLQVGKTLLVPSLGAAAFASSRETQRARLAKLHGSLDQIRRARATKRVELREDGMQLGAAAAVLLRVGAALENYDAEQDLLDEEDGRSDQRLAAQIRLAVELRKLADILAYPELARAGNRFLTDRPKVAITGAWTATTENTVAWFKKDQSAGMELFGVNMTALELTEWVEAGRNLELIAELANAKGTITRDNDTKTILENVLAVRGKGAGLHKYALGKRGFQPWFDPAWLDLDTLQPKDERQAFGNAVFTHPKTLALRKNYPNHLPISARQLPLNAARLWIWFVPRIDVWVDKILSDATLKQAVEPLLTDPASRTWLDWMYAIQKYIRANGTQEDKAQIKDIAKSERADSQERLARDARRVAAKQIRAWLEDYDQRRRTPFWIPNRVYSQIGQFASFIIDRPEEQKWNVAALVIDVAPDLAAKFAPPRARSDNVTGVAAMLVTGVVSLWGDRAFTKALQRLLPEYNGTQLVERIGILRQLGKLLRDSARTVQHGGGMEADAAGQWLKTQKYRGKIHAVTKENPEYGFNHESRFWRIRKVHESFVYHPPYPDLDYALDYLKFQWPDGARWVRTGLIETPDGTRIDDNRPLMSVSITDLDTLEVQELEIRADSFGQLERLYTDLSWNALLAFLKKTGDVIEAGFWLVYELAELIPGVGQGLMALRFFTTVVDFLTSPEFSNLMSAIGRDGIQALEKKLDELSNIVEIDKLVAYMLFAGQRWAPKVPEQRGATNVPTSHGPWASLGKLVKNLIYLAKRLIRAIQNVRKVVQVPFRGAQAFVVGHPLFAAFVRLVRDHADQLGMLSLDTIAELLSFGDTAAWRKSFSKTVKGGADRVIEGVGDAFTNLRFMRVPAQLIRLDFIVETVFDVLISRMGPKFKLIGGGTREVLQKTNLWGKVTSAVSRQIAKVADPNDLWLEFVGGPLRRRLASIRQQITDEVRGAFTELGWVDPAPASSKDMSITPAGEDFEHEEIDDAPSAEAMPFLEDNPEALAHWTTRPAIAIPTNGARLDAPTRARGEQAFGHDLGHVRLHTGAAGEAGVPPGARAVTAGSHVFLGSSVDRQTPSGASVLFHELAHVVQQTGPRPVGAVSSIPVAPRATGVVWNRAAEESATRAAGAVDAGALARVDHVGFAGLQPMASATAKGLLEKLVDQQQVRAEAASLVTPRMVGLAQSTPHTTEIATITKAVGDAIDRRIDGIPGSKAFDRPFHLVRADLAAAIAKRKTRVRDAIRSIVFWKGEVVANKYVVAPRALANELERFFLGDMGIAATIELAVAGPTVATTGDIVTKFELGFVALAGLGADARPIVEKAVQASFRGEPTLALHLRQWVTSAMLFLERNLAQDAWLLTSFAFNKDAKRAIRFIFNDLHPDIERAGWPDPLTYAKPDPVPGAFEWIGLRVGTYGEQEAHVSGTGRNSHHVLQVAFVEYLQNQKKTAKPFPYLAEFPKAYKKLGVETDLSGAKTITGPGGQYIDLAHLASGKRADPMPTILLSNYAHKAPIHLHSDDNRFTKDILHAAFRGSRETLFGTMLTRKVLQKIEDTADAQRVVEGSMTTAALHETIYRAARETYRAAWPDEHQTRLRRFVAKLEPEYYATVVAERAAKATGTGTSSAQLTPALTSAAVTKVINLVDHIIGEHGFVPA